jgi:hypothetical protein
VSQLGAETQQDRKIEDLDPLKAAQESAQLGYFNEAEALALIGIGYELRQLRQAIVAANGHPA